MIIEQPQLVPIEGYVEDIDEDENHYLRKTEEQLEKEAKEKTISDLTLQLAESDDAAIASYEAQAATDDAMLAIYDKIGG